MNKDLLLKIELLAKQILINYQSDYLIKLVKDNKLQKARYSLDLRIEYLNKLIKLTDNIHFKESLDLTNQLRTLITELIDKRIDGDRKKE